MTTHYPPQRHEDILATVDPSRVPSSFFNDILGGTTAIHYVASYRPPSPVGNTMGVDNDAFPWMHPPSTSSPRPQSPTALRHIFLRRSSDESDYCPDSPTIRVATPTPSTLTPQGIPLDSPPRGWYEENDEEYDGWEYWLDEGVSDDQLRTLPRFHVRDDAEGASECSICMSAMSEQPTPNCKCEACSSANPTLTSMPRCGHVYHHVCLKRWLWSSTACPLCRSEFTETVTVD